MYHFGLMIALVVVVGQALNLVATRRLKVLSVLVIQWYYALTSSIVTGTCVLFSEKSFKLAFTDASLGDWGLILAIAVLNNLA